MNDQEKILYLENKINELEVKFNAFKETTAMQIKDVNDKYDELKEELYELKSELQVVKTNTNTILNINNDQTKVLSSIADRLATVNIDNVKFLQGISKKQLAIIGGVTVTIGSVITFLIYLIKILLGI